VNARQKLIDCKNRLEEMRNSQDGLPDTITVNAKELLEVLDYAQRVPEGSLVGNRDNPDIVVLYEDAPGCLDHGCLGYVRSQREFILDRDNGFFTDEYNYLVVASPVEIARWIVERPRILRSFFRSQSRRKNGKSNQAS